MTSPITDERLKEISTGMASVREYRSIASELLAAREALSNHEEALQRIVQWADAYPLDIFPEPDLKLVKDLVGGEMLGRISASAMRHVVNGVGDIARSALTGNRSGK